MVREPFSDQFERWLQSNEPKTLGKLGEVFGEKSFAVTVMLLMFVPAIPAPTGGITHVFEVITVFIGAEMIVGARTMWLPARWRDRELGETATTRLSPSSRERSDGSSGSPDLGLPACTNSGGSCASSD